MGESNFLRHRPNQFFVVRECIAVQQTDRNRPKTIVVKFLEVGPDYVFIWPGEDSNSFPRQATDEVRVVGAGWVSCGAERIFGVVFKGYAFGNFDDALVKNFGFADSEVENFGAGLITYDTLVEGIDSISRSALGSWNAPYT